MDKSSNIIKAIILDLDGVITNTEILHITAWKMTFDTFIDNFNKTNKLTIPLLDPVHDYRTYIDGRPRYEGAEAFLLSRNINLPYGNPGDTPEKETICGLANKKNGAYTALLQKKGAHVYNDTISAVKKWRIEGKKTAVISASKNCRLVLSSTGISNLFDAIVDGTDSEEKHIKGKPQPDIFLYAAKQLNLDPSEIAIVEDSSAGILAGKSGHFALLIGVSRDDTFSLLYKSGADIVVSSLFQIVNLSIILKKGTNEIPNALDSFNTVKSHFIDSIPLLLLDYDGTLTPIVPRPEQAILSHTMRETLSTLNKYIKVAIVSGRDLYDVKKRINLGSLIYAGSHGFDIEGPDHFKMQPPEAKKALPDIDNAESIIRDKLQGIQNIIIERKKFMITVHFRFVAENEIDKVIKVMQEITSSNGSITMTKGKKVLEIRPDIPWNKGKAVSYIADTIFGTKKRTFPLYLGDDITDEDAFREMKGWGIGILIGDHGEKSYADYHLSNTDEVLQFLKKLLSFFQNPATGSE